MQNVTKDRKTHKRQKNAQKIKKSTKDKETAALLVVFDFYAGDEKMHFGIV